MIFNIWQKKCENTRYSIWICPDIWDYSVLDNRLLSVICQSFSRNVNLERTFTVLIQFKDFNGTNIRAFVAKQTKQLLCAFLSQNAVEKILYIVYISRYLPNIEYISRYLPNIVYISLEPFKKYCSGVIIMVWSNASIMKILVTCGKKKG